MPTDLNSRKKSSLAAKKALVKAPPLPPASDDLKCVDVPMCLHHALTLFVGSEEIVGMGTAVTTPELTINTCSLRFLPPALEDEDDNDFDNLEGLSPRTGKV